MNIARKQLREIAQNSVRDLTDSTQQEIRAAQLSAVQNLPRAVIEMAAIEYMWRTTRDGMRGKPRDSKQMQLFKESDLKSYAHQSCLTREVEIDGKMVETYTSPHNAHLEHILGDTKLKEDNCDAVNAAMAERRADNERLIPKMEQGMTLTEAAHDLAGGD